MVGDEEEPTVKIFLSWAHANGALKDRFIDLLMPRLKILSGVRFEWWEDSHIWLGEDWRREIAARASEADFALQLLSPEFFASDVIVDAELPPFIGPAASGGCLPVGLSRIAFEPNKQRLHGVDAKQIYLLDGRSFFSEVRANRREAFASEVATRIQERVLRRPQWRPV